jgi:catechol 2,3-dioxygenase-like lactoylglutathione lyase family enzyme
MATNHRFPRFRQVVLDTPDVRRLGDFYRDLLGFAYREGNETPQPDEDWLVIVDPVGGRRIAFQKVDSLPPTTWPDDDVAQQAHFDLTVADTEELNEQHHRVLTLGATLRLDRSDDPEEALRVYADPDGHLFCLFVGEDLG